MIEFNRKVPVEGTLVYLEGLIACGVIINRDFWKKEAQKESLKKVRDFEKLETEFVPLLFFGGIRIAKKLIGNRVTHRLERFGYSRLDSNLKIIFDLEELITFIFQHLHYPSRYPAVAVNPEKAIRELKILRDYFQFCRGENSSCSGEPFFKILEKALPFKKK